MFLLKYKYLALTSLSLVLAGVFAQPSQATKAIYPKTRPLLLSYKQLQQLPKPARNEYIRSISKELVIISQLSKKRRKLNTTASWLFELLIETAQANQSIRGLCGGVFDRVNTAGGSCGVNSYAGFTCANPEHEICNPLIFGVYPASNGQPARAVCFANATTDLCFQRTRTGSRGNTTLDPVFAIEANQQEWETFRQDYSSICIDQNWGSISERRATAITACNRVYRQLRVNNNRISSGEVSQSAPSGATAVDLSSDPLTGRPNTDLAEADSDLPAQPVVDEAALASGITDAERELCNRASVTGRIPRHNPQADYGTDILNSVPARAGPARDTQLAQAVVCGSFPANAINMVPVRMENHIVCVSADYLSVGNETDARRIAFGQNNSMRVAASLGMMLPTADIVDAIVRQTDPRYFVDETHSYTWSDHPTTGSKSTSRFIHHDDRTDAALGFTGVSPELTSGQKKDLIISRDVANTARGDRATQVALYGWHCSQTGRRCWQDRRDHVQPMETPHNEEHADYSHGVRLVSPVAFRTNADGTYNEESLIGLVSDGTYSRDGRIDRGFLETNFGPQNAIECENPPDLPPVAGEQRIPAAQPAAEDTGYYPAYVPSYTGEVR